MNEIIIRIKNKIDNFDLKKNYTCKFTLTNIMQKLPLLFLLILSQKQFNQFPLF